MIAIVAGIIGALLLFAIGSCAYQVKQAHNRRRDYIIEEDEDEEEEDDKISIITHRKEMRRLEVLLSSTRGSGTHG